MHCCLQGHSSRQKNKMTSSDVENSTAKQYACIELKITDGHWPFSVQLSAMATQNLYRWPNQNFSLASQTRSLIFSSACRI